MASFVLEVGTEELPSLFLPSAEQELKKSFFSELEELGYASFEVASFSTPRRLVVYIPAIDVVQPTSEESVVGPPVRIAFDSSGNPTKAAEKFALSLGVSIDSLVRIENEKGEYLAGLKKFGGSDTALLLGKASEKVLRSLYLPKRMRWEGSNGETFLRPVRWILSLFDQKIVPITFCGATSSDKTFGHRVHGPGPFKVSCSDEFFSALKDFGKITLDREERRNYIVERGDALASEVSGLVLWNDKLLEEAAGLAEHPYLLLGDIDERFLGLPTEILLTSMEKHQKSFGVKSFEGKGLSPLFLTVLNVTPTNIEVVKQGWERVLRARLSDAYFFWKTDIEQSFETWLEKLEKVTFLEPLGNMLQKTRRISAVCVWFAQKFSSVDPEDAKEAGLLSKGDLVSETVKEFDSLQGVMGGIYAKRQGKKEAVAKALSEQYLPSGPDSDIPRTDLGCILSIADKIDTLAGCFGLDMAPTGTSDPYALRRCALGVLRILLEKKYPVRIEELIITAQKNYENVRWKSDEVKAREELKTFFMARLKNYFSTLGYESRTIDAVLNARSPDLDSVCRIARRLEILKLMSESSKFEPTVLSFKRVVNILAKLPKDDCDSLSEWSKDLFAERAENDLSDYLETVYQKIFEAVVKEDAHKALFYIEALAERIDVFFEKVMVMCEDKRLRDNRLRLLKGAEDILIRIADFSALQV